MCSRTTRGNTKRQPVLTGPTIHSTSQSLIAKSPRLKGCAGSRMAAGTCASSWWKYCAPGPS
jgi:hypothetical protein